MHIVMVAAENGTLPGAKVGGIGDVIRDVPRALAKLGHQVTVLTPGYQSLSKLPGATLLNTLTGDFSSALETVELYLLDTPDEPPLVQHMVLEHQLFAACGIGQIYCHDNHEPFATDASKFALFCHGACYALVTGAIASPDVLHLHDWHAALMLLLRQSHPAYQSLHKATTVFTIHNLSLQGVRPFADNPSSPAHWFVGLKYPAAQIADPVYPQCVNLMRIGINLADKVHVVSPTYAREILLPSNPRLGLIRGEGLEKDLLAVKKQGNLHGILNGCDYSAVRRRARKPARKQFITEATLTLERWVGNNALINSSFFYAQQRLLGWAQRTQKDQCVVASVGRLTPQKVSLLQVTLDSGITVLDSLLAQLDKGCMIMLGSGDAACENFMTQVMRRHENFLFLCGYSEPLGELLYHYCDLFLMPSSFEPCGISQMLAMRAGSPCLVHKVGGLADTVQHRVNGFAFSGEDQNAQAQNLVMAFRECLGIQSNKLPVWQSISSNAADARFLWEHTVMEYEQKLYARSK